MSSTAPVPESYPIAEVEGLVRRGVIIPAPHLVSIARDVPLEAIAPGAALHPFSRLAGARTRIDAGAVLGPGGAAAVLDSWVGEGAVVGSLGPVTLRGATVGPRAVLGCGVAEQAVFLGREGEEPDFTTGYGFRARPGSLYEEDASSAQHTDTKMTLLFPWVTLGSDLNWCDILVSGGTGPELGRFSEIGSGAIHFNFTPRGDKATASSLGNVVDGVFLRQLRLFVGGNASLVGPLRASFGAVTGAGGRFTRSLRRGLNLGDPLPERVTTGFDLEIYGSVRRVYVLQVVLIGELAALDAWYGAIRERLAAGRPSLRALYAAGRALVRLNLAERIAQLGRLAVRLERSAALLERVRPGDPRIAQHRALADGWARIEPRLQAFGAVQREPPPSLLQALEQAAAAEDGRYTRTIQALPDAAVTLGTAWMRAMARALLTNEILAAVPALPSRR